MKSQRAFSLAALIFAFASCERRPAAESLTGPTTVAQETPRLTETDVRQAADTAIEYGELYRQSTPLYVPFAKAWQVRYFPNETIESEGRKTGAIVVWVDDTTGWISRWP